MRRHDVDGRFLSSELRVHRLPVKQKQRTNEPKFVSYPEVLSAGDLDQHGTPLSINMTTRTPPIQCEHAQDVQLGHRHFPSDWRAHVCQNNPIPICILIRLSLPVPVRVKACDSSETRSIHPSQGSPILLVVREVEY